MNSKMDPV